MKFDIIIGNPPFQAKNSGGGGLGGNQKKLYIDFVLLAQKILKEDGYMALITPGNWRCGMKQITKRIGNFLKERIIYLDINTSKKYFKEGSSFDWYIMKNAINNKSILVNTTSGKSKIKLNDYQTIPNILNDSVMEILNAVLYNNNGKIPLIGTDERIKGESDIMTNVFKYPLIQAGEKNKDRVWYGREKHSLQDEKKVFISAIADGGVIHVGKDYGTAGIWGNQYLICKTNDEVDMYYGFFNSTLFRFIIKINSFNRFFNYALSKYIPKIDIDDFKESGSNYYTYFGLNEKLIKFIEDFMK